MILSEATISGQWGGSRSICSVPAVAVVGKDAKLQKKVERGNGLINKISITIF